MDSNYYLNQDDNDILEWIDTVPFYPSLLSSAYDYDSPELKYWKNAYWSVKWRLSGECIIGYVGINKCSELPDDWTLKYKYLLALCPTTGDPSLVKWSEIHSHIFKKPLDDYLDFCDVRLPPPSFILHNSGTYLTEDNHILLKCRLEAVPLPFIVQQGYDPKKTTGMVGLENLGATCYLNALLQVCLAFLN